MRSKFLGVFLIVNLTLTRILFAQTLVEGYVSDRLTLEAIPMANIVLVNQNKAAGGTSTTLEGYFFIEVPNHIDTLTIKHIGYQDLVIALSHTSKTITFENLLMKREAYGLEEVGIVSAIANERTTPIAISTIRSEVIERELGDRPFPEILKMVPGIYATRYGGGSGDARVSIRGFQQENIALLLNGIPVSSVENGLVYWNNWLGLAEATEFIQVQKGLGASKVALNSVGGTINIITKSTDAKKGGSLFYSVTSYGNHKVSLGFSTGKLKNGISVTFLASRTKGPGYVDATYVDAWAYFLTLSKEFNKNNKITFTALGAPERHGQRSFKLSQEEIDIHGIKYNKSWGSYNGEINNLTENFYHKPHFALNHYLNLNSRALLATSAYLTFGYGGGKWSETYQPNPYQPTNLRIAEIINPSGQINWNLVYLLNAMNTDTAYLDNGETVTGFSKNIQTHFLANHVWYGALSTLKFELNDKTRLIAGLHARHFKSHLYEKISDLLGGKYFIEDYSWSLAGVAGRDQIKTVGDIIKIDNRTIINYGSVFAQFEYKPGNMTVFLGGTFSNTWFQRIDQYNYTNETKSEVLNKDGWDVKGGVSYNINPTQRIYMNAGYYSKAPYYKFVFGNFTNVPVPGLENEKIKAIELGYSLRGESLRINLNTYYTYWQDKNFLSNEYIQLQNNDQTRALVTGLDALHMGIELEIMQDIGSNISLGGIASIGDWKWKNNVSATLYNDDNIAVDTVQVFADGLYVGDAPQTQLGIVGKIKIFDRFRLRANILYNERLYADFDPTQRNNPEDRAQPYRIPGYTIMDLHLGYGFVAFGKSAYAMINCFNVFNRISILRGEDGTNHDLDSFKGFWTFGRTFSFSIKLEL